MLYIKLLSQLILLLHQLQTKFYLALLYKPKIQEFLFLCPFVLLDLFADFLPALRRVNQVRMGESTTRDEFEIAAESAVGDRDDSLPFPSSRRHAVRYVDADFAGLGLTRFEEHLVR